MPQMTHEEAGLRQAPRGVLSEVSRSCSATATLLTQRLLQNQLRPRNAVFGEIVLLTKHWGKYLHTIPETASTRQNLEHQKKLPIT